MKDYDYWLEKTTSEGRWFDEEGFMDDEADMEPPTDKELDSIISDLIREKEELEKLEKSLKEKGYMVKS